MAKFSNSVVRLAYEGATILSNSPALSSEAAMAAFDVTEVLQPFFKRMENERLRIARKIGESDQGIQLPSKATLEQQEDYQRRMTQFVGEMEPIMEGEVELPELPKLSLTRELFMQLRGLTGQQMGSLRKIGVLVIEEPTSRAEKRRVAKLI